VGSFIAIVLAFVILELIIWLGLVYIRKSPLSYEESWRELARRAGLEYSTVGASSSGKKTAPSVSGTYRGYSITLHRVINEIGFEWWPRSYNITAYTRIWLIVNNPSDGYLMIRNAATANVQLKKLFGVRGVPTGDTAFGKRIFIEKSQPEDFSKALLGSDVLRHALQTAFGDTTRRHIELTDKRLRLQEVWDPSHMRKRNVEYLHRHLDALVDLAEAIDQQKQFAAPKEME
jgi:hypothetical protein